MTQLEQVYLEDTNQLLSAEACNERLEHIDNVALAPVWQMQAQTLDLQPCSVSLDQPSQFQRGVQLSLLPPVAVR